MRGLDIAVNGLPVHRNFDIACDARGYWIARETHGLVGGVFRSQKDALRFALFEADGDSASVRLDPARPPGLAPEPRG